MLMIKHKELKHFIVLKNKGMAVFIDILKKFERSK